MKKLVLFISMVVCLAGIAEAQILTRFAVVDLNRVYMAYFSESRPVREYNERRTRVQTELDRMTVELNSLRAEMAEARARGNTEQILRLEMEVNRRTDFLREYYQTQMTALESQLSRLTQDSSFLEQIYDEIRFIAESEGYSAVLNLGDAAGILWYSPTVDITDRLIRSLHSRGGR